MNDPEHKNMNQLITMVKKKSLSVFLNEYSKFIYRLGNIFRNIPKTCSKLKLIIEGVWKYIINNIIIIRLKV